MESQCDVSNRRSPPRSCGDARHSSDYRRVSNACIADPPARAV
ncbi:hypothetical protein BURPSS13_X0910 [Burkholderia pseudomallei S13]|nr:hypothetical protein BURPSS13_X0910 [Burkholderia pseudomallei S13]